jgi:hypothetical protein
LLLIIIISKQCYNLIVAIDVVIVYK